MSTLTASFGDDIRTYADAGVDGIGIWEMKLDDDSLEQFRAGGLGAASAVPEVPSILPLPLLPGPDDPAERIDSILRSLNRLAPFEPTAVIVLTGPGSDRDTVVTGLQEVADEAKRLGLRLALEPYQQVDGEQWSPCNSLGEAAELIDETGRGETIGIQFDTWHLWNTPNLFEEIEQHFDRIAGVHVNDYREPTRGWVDRALPGDGAADVPAILGALDRAGWTGYYDLEVFSDNGAFGTAYPDSLWDIDPAELVRRGREAFDRCWQERRVAA